MSKAVISEIDDNDLHEIFSLANKVVKEHVFPMLSEDGIKSIQASLKTEISDILNRELYQALKVKIDGKVVGYIACRNGDHITQLYVDSAYQGRGIGTILIDAVIKQATGPVLKVRASLNAVSFYKNVGFVPQGNETEINGIKFMPMEYKLSSK